MSTQISKLQEWYNNQCNGEWEHSYGISIETLDNPGWKVRIDLKATRFKDANWPEIKVDNGEHDWFICKVREGCFEGMGDPSKLEKILDQFLSHTQEAITV